MSLTRVDFAGAADAGDDGHDAEGEVGGDVLQVVGAGVLDGDPVAGEGARLDCGASDDARSCRRGIGR